MPSNGIRRCLHARLRLATLGQINRQAGEKTRCVRPRKFIALTSFAAVVLAATAASAQKKYDPGASDTEIRIGNIMPYSGPASSYGVIGKTEAAFFNMVNAEGGINGRKINFIS